MAHRSLEAMLDATNDPVADIINSVSSDVIARFVGRVAPAHPHIMTATTTPLQPRVARRLPQARVASARAGAHTHAHT